LQNIIEAPGLLMPDVYMLDHTWEEKHLPLIEEER
jgi:hypothetical protein